MRSTVARDGSSESPLTLGSLSNARARRRAKLCPIGGRQSALGPVHQRGRCTVVETQLPSHRSRVPSVDRTDHHAKLSAEVVVAEGQDVEAGPVEFRAQFCGTNNREVPKSCRAARRFP